LSPLWPGSSPTTTPVSDPRRRCGAVVFVVGGEVVLVDVAVVEVEVEVEVDDATPSGPEVAHAPRASAARRPIAPSAGALTSVESTTRSRALATTGSRRSVRCRTPGPW
jgi:hypothetical protein